MNFEETVKSMSIKEIIMAMVRGLRNPRVKVDMSTLGRVIDGVFSGCAATNTVCEIMGKTYGTDVIEDVRSRSKFINCDVDFLDKFETSIDTLRHAETLRYNKKAARAGMALMTIEPVELPYLCNYYTSAELDTWEKYANTL